MVSNATRRAIRRQSVFAVSLVKDEGVLWLATACPACLNMSRSRPLNTLPESYSS